MSNILPLYVITCYIFRIIYLSSLRSLHSNAATTETDTSVLSKQRLSLKIVPLEVTLTSHYKHKTKVTQNMVSRHIINIKSSRESKRHGENLENLTTVVSEESMIKFSPIYIGVLSIVSHPSGSNSHTKMHQQRSPIT